MSTFGKIDSITGTSTAGFLKQKDKLSADGSDGSFSQYLKSAINDTNKLQVQKEEVISDMATGQVQDLHQAALSIGKAETSMKLMLEIRNKAISAYRELGKTQI